MNPILKAIELAGSQTRLGELAGVSQATVSDWLNGKKVISAENVMSLCAALKWRITPHELRPDIYPNRRDAIPKGARLVRKPSNKD